MKNTIAVLTVVGLMIVALPVSAAVDLRVGADSKIGVQSRLLDRINMHGDSQARLHESGQFGHEHGDHHDKPFMVMGKVKSATADELVIEITNGMRGQVSQGEEVVVKIDSSTKIKMNGEDVATNDFDLLVGQNVLVKAKHADSDNAAQMVVVTGQKQRIFGEVTAISGDSMTVVNGQTGETKVVEITQDTKVKINGEDSGIEDIQQGDKVMVKIKATVDSWIAKAISIFR